MEDIAAYIWPTLPCASYSMHHSVRTTESTGVLCTWCLQEPASMHASTMYQINNTERNYLLTPDKAHAGVAVMSDKL